MSSTRMRVSVKRRGAAGMKCTSKSAREREEKLYDYCHSQTRTHAESDLQTYYKVILMRIVRHTMNEIWGC